MSFTDGPVHEHSDIIVQNAPAPVVAVATDGPVVVAADPVSGGQARTSYASRTAPDAIIAALVGLVVLVTGLIAVVRGGFDGPLSLPVVSVIGFTHTTLLGLIEIGLGAALLISGASRSRAGETLFGSALGIAGFVGAVQTQSFAKSLALESAMAWLAVVAGVVVVIAAVMLPRFARNSTTITQV